MSVQTLRLFVLPGGDVIGRYNDRMVHGGERPKKVKRVSNVEWDEANQSWMTTVSTMVMWTATRLRALELEGEFIDTLLSDFMSCWRPEGGFACPDCRHTVVPVEMVRCPVCGYAFKNYIEGLKLSDLPFQELLAV